MNFFERFGGIAIIGGVLCYAFAFCLLIVAPHIMTDAAIPMVRHFETGEKIPVPEYTEQEARGREIYIREICWHCHSQFVRPVNEEDVRWGPVSQAGESMVDQPHLFSTRRIGPDLAREGGRRHDDWQMAHLYNPRYTVGTSVMPAFTWLFKPWGNAEEAGKLLRALDTDGDGIVSPKFDDKSVWPGGLDVLKEVRIARIDAGGVLAPTKAHSLSGDDVRDGSYKDEWTGRDVGDGLLTDYDIRPRPTQEAKDLVAYLQRLGIAIGKWRRPIPGGTPTRAYTPPMKGVEDVLIEKATGEGDDTEDWTVSIADGLMPMRAVEARMYGLALEKASKEDLQERDDTIREYDVLMKAWRKANPEWDTRLRKGEELYVENCAPCHGAEGRGNGEAAQWLRIRPRDFTRAKYRYRSTTVGNRPLDGDLYRTLYRGLPGTSMPDWRKLGDENLWILVDYLKHFAETTDGDRGKPWDDDDAALAVPPVPPLDPEMEEEILARGKMMYSAMKCSNCHGATGRGDGPGWNGTTKDNGGIVRPRDFAPRSDRDQPEMRYRAGATPQDLYRTIMTGLEGTGMPANIVDFENAFDQADALKAAKKAGASEDEIAKLAKRARRSLFIPLKDENLEGVVTETGEDGTVTEYVESLVRSEVVDDEWVFGDDWALVYYVMHLSGLEWPNIMEEE